MKTFVIAEAGINHDGDLDRAKQLALQAKECGCSAVKFQTYQTDKRVTRDNPAYDILKRCELSFEQQKELKLFCDQVGIEFFSTPFDTESLRFLVEDLGLRRIKLASFDVTNTKFLDAVNEYGKQHPVFRVIMSTGMANSLEINTALDHLKNVAYLTLLHCVSSYPTKDQDANLSAIQNLRHMVHGARTVGYSDHTRGFEVPAASVLVGATTVEKHFTLDYNGPGVDNAVSADPTMMKALVARIQLYEHMLGDGQLEMQEVERAAQVFRRTS